ncbi:hypothetical protein K469DRAFT_711930 [Zopfia rhizophila CBS 207.26]|uniref:Heterokaryon incompatibility domain-containing protein n=1 Tax=Zopfia rhizophila CBS 207.26 TaxID=1314779 RepID=A0A6A6DXF3_9PEZI|nr:hypothetical protein K469DRAFT_711930 [Zopfia rhizophila CBS 207.26]
MNELPRTLKDAIRTVRALGIDFIWIDAVCTYPDRSRIKYRRNLRSGPLFSEASDSAHLACRTGKIYSPRFRCGNLSIRRSLPSSNNAAFASPCLFFVSIQLPILVLKLREFRFHRCHQ